MKKLFVVLFTVVSIRYSYAQTVVTLNDSQFSPMAIAQSAIATTLEATKLDQKAQMALTALEYAETAFRFEQQVRQWTVEADRYVKQLTSFQNITDYSSFMDWYNRSLEYERHLNESIFGANIQIGSRYYSWAELDQLGSNMQMDFDITREFTEEQRRDLWINMGHYPIILILLFLT